ncbi:hypothetical protein CVT26_010655 [Gymnopilus dilepis]|uniref:RING-type domain-containing protein n=1 Tax=Gymnopilus dilepis TaxID=231916 RepID=A0A409VIC7_9AGAR|nr:hypothetical protein CVT26_010655 [Gymnopilus dilepis]
MSFSVPTSPAMSRSTKAQPVTPQRLPRHQPRSHSFYRSPLTPSASPYTPLSLRSLDSTGSSTLTTPENIGSGVKKRLAFSAGSPSVVRNVSVGPDRSLADIAENWRTRANENGIKVSNISQEDSHYVPDDSSDMSLSDVGNDSSMISTEEALLAPPFLSAHRRLNSLPITNRPRAQSHASLPSRVHPLSPVTSRTNNCPSQTSSPLQSRRTVSQSFSHSANVLATPPPNRTLARQLKLKGSLTDPAPPRKREVFGNSSTPYHIGNRSANMSVTLEPDTSLDLFDIDENEYEYDNEYQGSEAEDSFSRDLEAFQNNNYGYPTFAQSHHPAQPQVFHQSHFGDPFQHISAPSGLVDGHILNSMTDSLEHPFHAGRQQLVHSAYYDDRLQPGQVLFNQMPSYQHQFSQAMPRPYPAPAFVPVPPPAQLPFHHQHAIPAHPQPPQGRTFSPPVAKALFPPSTPEPSPTDCSVCLASHPTSLAILQPCKHPLCSTCLTSALNIVGEKDMECAVCKQSVADFKLVMKTSNSSQGSRSSAGTPKNDTHSLLALSGQSDMAGKSFMDPISPASSMKTSDPSHGSGALDELQSAFEFGLELGGLRASTPKREHEFPNEGRSRSYTTNAGRRDIRRDEDNVVLRIDNVPWDITPRQIVNWLQQPVEMAHVLLDSKGKTLSHAYVEVKDAATAGAILRGETVTANAAGRKERGSVLGRGRRARGVTITRSSQQELMSDLFPHWRGNFDGSRPSLAGLDGDRLIMALEGGLLTEHEISALSYLIREPDSHFLKVPSLPFHSLVSLLSKFPTDVDSRVFWSANIRDALFDATYDCYYSSVFLLTAISVSLAAIGVLLPRVEQAKEKAGQQEEEYAMDLVMSLLHKALNCQAFTGQQILRLKEHAQACSLPLPEADSSAAFDDSASSSFSVSSSVRTPSSQDSSTAVLDRAKLNNSQVLDDLAKEFNLDAQKMPALVEALTQRLAKLS